MSDRQTQLRSQARTTRIHVPDRGLDRVWVRDTTSCPHCRAELGERCIGRSGPRERNHIERVRRALRG